MNTSTQRPSRRFGALALAAVLGVGGALAVAAPANADTGTWLAGGTSGATLSAPNVVTTGGSIHLEGSGWLDGTNDSGADGSWVAVKLGAAGGGGESGILTTEPAAGPFTYPGQTSGWPLIWSGAIADDSGSFSIDVPFPTVENTNSVFTTPWAVGETHHLQLLTGSIKPTGDTPRSVYVTFTITADAVIVLATNGGRGAPADQTTITVASSAANTFAPSESLSATVDGIATAWTAGGTASATGTLANSTLVLRPRHAAGGPAHRHGDRRHHGHTHAHGHDHAGGHLLRTHPGGDRHTDACEPSHRIIRGVGIVRGRRILGSACHGERQRISDDLVHDSGGRHARHLPRHSHAGRPGRELQPDEPEDLSQPGAGRR